MSPSLHSLGIDRLTRDERLALVPAIWETIANAPTPPLLTAGQREELLRRRADNDQSPADLAAWEVVRDQAAANLEP